MSSSPTCREVRSPSLDRILPRRPRRRPLVLPERPPAAGSSRPGLGVRVRGLLARLGAGGLPRPEAAPRSDPLLFLLRSTTQGFQLEEYERARALGYEGYLQEQLAPESLDDSALEARLAGHTTLALGPGPLLETYSEDFTEPYLQLKTAVILRAVHSRRQLLERACEFWNDHFSIDHNKGDFEWALLPEHDRLVTRVHALGSFPELLSAVAHGGAMLYYLDNWLNARGVAQENYARELLELHTLGLHGGYGESDVREVAKCFTGWTLGTAWGSGTFLRGVFVRELHAPGTKVVLGQEIPNLPPRDDAQRVLDLVAVHPSTARFLARKLLCRFLAPDPAETLVERVAERFLDSGGDVRAVLRLVLAREHLGPAGPRPRFRRPAHFVVALLRAVGADVSDALYPLFSLYRMGHVPFDHVQPDGYPDTVDAWGHSLLPRWQFASDLLLSAAPSSFPIPGVSISHASLAERVGFSGAGDRRGLARRIDERILGSALSPREVELLQEFIDDSPGFGVTAFLESIALGASLPGFQWY